MIAVIAFWLATVLAFLGLVAVAPTVPTRVLWPALGTAAALLTATACVALLFAVGGAG